ncbi:transforming growth factor-beta receptor-associated protein 1 homolog [Sycon ciliatum]|uniref:transforming growth factor-beta receptor-associated protein 1 homolog n=1 Tax=Sycon ciliatum TaxID=27933 RepID=UPI0020A90A77|eukprot:scpid41782/ scgid17538/ Transforming growth factor-beta receptor-associated protein 1 homolog
MSFRAFELVPVVERLPSDRSKVECFESFEENLYIGTSDCCVIYYVILQGVSPTGKITFQCQHKKSRQLSFKKPIEKIIVARALSRLLVLCDGTMVVLNSSTLDVIPMNVKQLKSISDMCPNESLDESAHLSFEVSFSFSKRKFVSVYTLTEDRLIINKELAVPEAIAKLRRDGQTICMASSSLFYLLDIDSGHCQSFFPLDCEVEAAFIQRIGSGEFLLRASDLGVFTDRRGEAKRAPLSLLGKPFEVAYHFPYVLALSYDQVHVYSVLTEEHKQTIAFQGGCTLGSFGKRVLIASHRQVYCLAMIELEQQVQHLFSQAHVTEALFLAQVSLLGDGSATTSNKKNERQLKRYQQQAGFAFLSQLQFEEAAEQFHESGLDYRELLALFPNLLSKSSDFRSQATEMGLHRFTDASTMVSGDVKKLQQLQEFVVSFLEDIRMTQAVHGKRDDLDTALLKLFAMANSKQLLAFIGGENTARVDESIETLTEHKRYHALGLFYCFHNMPEKALETWVQLNDGKLVDPAHPGMEYVVEFLASLTDHHLVGKFAVWALDKDQNLAATIFTHRPHNEAVSEFTRPDFVLDYLSKYSVALRIYLEHLVFTKKLEKEKYHTHLAVLYLDEVLDLQKAESCAGGEEAAASAAESQRLKDARHRLCRMLETSNLYRVTLLLGKIQDTSLYAESAILYGKLEQHEKALQLLVHRLKDYAGAQRYCTINSMDRDVRYRQRLFLALLTVYLTPVEGQGQLLVVQAMDLLNSSEAEFDVAQVLQILPETWPISLISNFLSRSIRHSMTRARSSRLQHSLARGEALQVKYRFIRDHSKPIIITEDRQCDYCQRPFNDAAFVRYPNGIVTHLHCSRRKDLCPVTGKWFGSNDPPS